MFKWVDIIDDPTEQEIHTIIMLFLSISILTSMFTIQNLNKKWDKIIKNNNFAFYVFIEWGA